MLIRVCEFTVMERLTTPVPHPHTYIMSNPSNALAVGSSSQMSAVAPSPSSSAPRAPTNVITYSYASRLVYVALAETYDVRSLPNYRFAKFAPSKHFVDRPSLCVQDAVGIAKESPRELKDVERKRIRFEINVNLVKTQ